MSIGLVRTLRIRSKRKAGGLGVLTTALGDAGASIGEISTLRIGHNYTLRDFHLILDDLEHVDKVLQAVAQLADSDVVEVIDTVRDSHRGGKIRTHSRVPLSGLAELSSAHLPGVREIVQAIEDEPALAMAFTSLPRTVALVSDGSGLQGVGKVRPRAMQPVLEGKAMLLSRLSGLSSLCLAVEVEHEDELVETIARLAPSFGAVLLDSIAAPRGPRTAQKLSERLQMPVYHDDADSPAIVGLAGVINACRRANLDLREATIGQIGLGTAGGAIARLIMRYGGRPVLGDDVHPAAISRHVSAGGVNSTLDEIMQKCDVVVANTGHGGVIPARSVRKGQVIIALSEPHPEIEPYEAQQAGAVFAADGKAFSSAAAFPGVLLGALSVQSTHISDEMRIAAALTMADVAHDATADATKPSALEGDLVPVPLDAGVHAKVAVAVARAAIRGGHAKHVDEALLNAAVFEELIADRRVLPLPKKG